MFFELITNFLKHFVVSLILIQIVPFPNYLPTSTYYCEVTMHKYYTLTY